MTGTDPRKSNPERLLAWARELDPGRIWAIEDCRHLSGGLERFLLRSGERVVRVPPKLAGAREFAKSDPLGAPAVARAALREGTGALPQARLQGPEREIALLLDHRERELSSLVGRQAPRLLAVPGCGPLTAARLVAEVAGVERFASDAKLAMLAGVAPLDASSGRRQRHRLNRNGNRRLNLAPHRIAVTQGRSHAPAREYLAPRQAEGKAKREALRALKRHLARRVFRIPTLIAEQANDPQRIEIGTAPRMPCLT